MVKSNKNSPNKPEIVKTTPLPIEQSQKKIPVNANSYTNGMSYAAKSAIKLNEDTAKTNSKSLENTSNFISTDEFPPVTVHKPPITKPTVASLFQTNRVIKQNSIKIPTQAVAPLPQQQQQQQESRSLSPIKKPCFIISPDTQQRCDSVEPIKNLNQVEGEVGVNEEDEVEEEEEENKKKDEIFNPSLLNEKLGSIVTPPPISLNDNIELETNVISKIVKKPVIAPPTQATTKIVSSGAMNKKSVLFPDFKDNGKDLEIDSTHNTPNVDSPKKAVGAERPFGFKPTSINLPTAIVAPSPAIPVITKPIGPVPHQQQILRDLIGNDNIPQQVMNTSNQQFIKTTPPPGLQKLSPLENNFNQQTTQQKLYNPLISTQFCELPNTMNPQILQMFLNTNTSINGNSMILNNSFINQQQQQQYPFINNSQTKLLSNNNQIIKQELHPIGSTRPNIMDNNNKFPQSQQQQQNKLNFNASSFQKLSMMNGCTTQNEYFE